MDERISRISTRKKGLEDRLGIDLAKRIYHRSKRYMGWGLAIGCAIGAVGYPLFSLIQSSGYDIRNITINQPEELLSQSFIGAAIGTNLGLVLGRICAPYEMRRLKKRFPERAEYIVEYGNLIRQIEEIIKERKHRRERT